MVGQEPFDGVAGFESEDLEVLQAKGRGAAANFLDPSKKALHSKEISFGIVFGEGENVGAVAST